MNENTAVILRDALKKLLNQCTEPQQKLFNRMYSHDNLERTPDEAVDNMDAEKLSVAIDQCQRTIDKKNEAPS